VDAIVRPQLTITQSPPRQLPKEQCCLFATGKVLEKFREWGSGPPPSDPVPVLPPPPLSGRVLGQGGADENHSHLELSQGAGNRATAGAHTLSHSPNSTGKRKTQRKALQILGVWCLTRLCNKCIKLQIVGVCLVRCCVVCACYRLNPAIKM
jgi:hypothetical protein